CGLGLEGVSGLKDAAALKIAGITDIAFAPSVGFPTSHLSGIHAKLGVTGSTPPDADQPPQPFAFTVDLTLNGSVSLTIAPVARETRMSLSSAWPHPSFSGAFLPDERQVTAARFPAPC